MKLITLTRGYSAIVDDADHEWLSMNNWQYHHRGYAVRNITDRLNHQKQVSMHRIIVAAQHGQYVDHVNGNGLDNRRTNLRICTSSQNQQNRRPIKGFKGVSWHKKKRKYIAHIGFNNGLIHIGYYSTAEEAALAYDCAAKERFGSFAHLNFGGPQG